MSALSQRLRDIADALPLRPGMRILEIGCGPGALAREIARRIGDGHVLAIDRSAKAMAQAKALSRDEIAVGRLTFRHVAAEEFELHNGEVPYDLAVAIRVGAFDGRHPQVGEKAVPRIRAALVQGGHLYIDGGKSLRAVPW